MSIIRKEGDFNLEKGLETSHMPNLLGLLAKVQTILDEVEDPNFFDSGTKMVFYQATAPVEWTIDTTNMDKTMLNLKNDGSGSPSWSGSVGGTHDIDSPPNTSHTHGNTGNKSLNESTVFQHRHQLGGANGPGSIFDPQVYILSGDDDADSSIRAIQWAYGSSSHNHSSISNNYAQFTPKYIDSVIAIKD